ncbi:hypothetical protein WICMUC_000029 [Wickerhamomyces mucosus]|uniref:Uncharacterized protein n=1 Tax=Wickerhamomyces mucosus TaxID=1378264 RepID=A0A9P8TJR9_9ASCO|nr:hypothetical protein WICMUC_000029 [Wickerhamomyces mucosus]
MMFLKILTLTKVSVANILYESTQNVIEVVDENEDPNAKTPYKIIGPYQGSPFSVDQPKPINPIQVLITHGITIHNLNSGSYIPLFAFTNLLIKRSETLPATIEPNDPPIKGAKKNNPTVVSE